MARKKGPKGSRNATPASGRNTPTSGRSTPRRRQNQSSQNPNINANTKAVAQDASDVECPSSDIEFTGFGDGEPSKHAIPSVLGKRPAEDEGAGYRPSTFTPFRSMLVGIDVESDEEGEVKEGEVKEDELKAAGVKDVRLEEVKEDDKEEAKDEGGAKEGAQEGELREAPADKNEEARDEVIVTKEDGSEKATKVAANNADDDENAAANTSVLLLPEHVHLAADDEVDIVVPDMEGVHMVDGPKMAGRYWMEEEDPEVADFLAEADQSKLCRRCKKPGHTQYKCPHIICETCGEWDKHRRRDCPWSLICFSCGLHGHRREHCPNPQTHKNKGWGCSRCGLGEHKANSCPLLWRTYIYRRADDRRRVLEEKENADGWKKQAMGGDPTEKWCYNCAEEGHFGDDCPHPRVSLARPMLNSAFSERSAGRGPFASEYAAKLGTHTRWEDDLPYASTSAFVSGVGAKGKQKAQKQARQRDRDRDRNDGDDWFNRRHHRMQPNPPRPVAPLPQRPIVFGNMNMPPPLSARIAPGPSRGKGKAGNNRNNGRNKEGRDFETQWRASGAGGGNVSSWGADMPRERRQQRDWQRDDRPRAGPPARQRGRGQRYTGGY